MGQSGDIYLSKEILISLCQPEFLFIPFILTATKYLSYFYVFLFFVSKAVLKILQICGRELEINFEYSPLHRSFEDTYSRWPSLYEPSAEENLWPLRQRAPLRVHRGLQDPLHRREPGHHQGEHWGRIQWDWTRGKILKSVLKSF